MICCAPPLAYQFSSPRTTVPAPVLIVGAGACADGELGDVEPGAGSGPEPGAGSGPPPILTMRTTTTNTMAPTAAIKDLPPLTSAPFPSLSSSNALPPSSNAGAASAVGGGALGSPGGGALGSVPRLAPAVYIESAMAPPLQLALTYRCSYQPPASTPQASSSSTDPRVLPTSLEWLLQAGSGRGSRTRHHSRHGRDYFYYELLARLYYEFE